MKKILLSIWCVATATTHALDFTVSSLNMYMFDTGIVGKLTNKIKPEKITQFNNVLHNKNPHPSGPDKNATIPGLQDIDIMCFQEWPSGFGSNATPQFPAHYQGSAIAYSGSMCVLTMINTKKFTIVEPTKQLPNVTNFSPYWPQTVTVIQPNSTSIKIGIINAHLKGGVPPDQTVQQANNISAYMAQRPDITHWIVCGDFNMRGKYQQVMSALNLHEVDGPSGSTVTEYHESAGYARLDGIFYSANTITKLSNDQYPLSLQAFIGGTGPGLYNHWITDHALIRAQFQIKTGIIAPTSTPQVTTPATSSFSLDFAGVSEPFSYGTKNKVPYATIAQQSYNAGTDDYSNGLAYEIAKSKIKVSWYPKTNTGKAQIDDGKPIDIAVKADGLHVGTYTVPSGTTIAKFSMNPQWPMRAIATIAYAMIQDYANRPKTESSTEDLVKLAESLHELHATSAPKPVAQPSKSLHATGIPAPEIAPSGIVDITVKDLNPVTISTETTHLLESLKDVQTTEEHGQTTVLIPLVLGQKNLQIIFDPNSPNELIGNVFNNNLEAAIKKSGNNIIIGATHNLLGADSQKILDLGLAIFEYLRTNKPLPTASSADVPATKSVPVHSPTGHLPTPSSHKGAPLHEVALHSLAHPGVTIKLQIIDIINSNADAIVNAANANCLGGGGIDAAITGASQGDGSTQEGQAVAAARKALPGGDGNRCPEGQARVTISGLLKPNKGIKYIIQATAPNCGDANAKIIGSPLEKVFTNLYFNILNTAYLVNNTTPHKGLLIIKDPAAQYTVTDEGKIASIAIPSMGTGIFACNFDDASSIAVRETIKFLNMHKNSDLKEIRFVFWEPGTTKGSGTKWLTCMGFVNIYESHLNSAGFN